ncbi:ABC transporter ATP-binding protein [Streptomyces sp. NPDC059611]|uniref:ABC transporter ATP-binding protein n=1 Tax=Streptomyces sp. NPDC059611 TaxID=3346884 RepID=UPI0036A072D5
MPMGGESVVLAAAGVGYDVAGRTLLDGLDLTVRQGESVAVSGPSGSGKSTLLTCLLGLIKPQRGSIQVAGVELTELRERALAQHRRTHLGVVFQFGELLPELTPLENTAIAALLGGVRQRDAYAQAEELLTELKVPFGKTPTAQLSGGERQRTAVARALINKPALVLADEPTGALDETTRDEVAALLFSVPQRWKCGLVVVTHDATVAARADRHLALAGGELIEARGAGVRS